MKNLFKYLGTFLLLFLFSTVSTFAQWAGPDQKIARNNDNSQTVTLSVLQIDPNACYSWTGLHIQGDANQPSVTANPQDSIQTYVCKRISQNGVDEDEVIVSMLDSIVIVSVKAKKNCYLPGDEITTDQFTIVTDPVGYENQVTVQPSIMTANNAGSAKENVELTFTLSAFGHTSTKKTNVVCVNNDLEANVSIDLRFQILAKKIQTFRNCTTLLNNLAQKGMATGKFPGMQRKQPTISGNFSAPTVGFHFACCNNKDIALANIQWNGFSVSAGFETFFPFYIPAVLGLNIYISLGVSIWANLGLVNVDISLEQGCSSAEIGVAAGATVSGNVGVSYINPNILSAQMGLEGAASTTWKWDVLNGKWNNEPLAFKINLVGKITVISFVVFSGSKTLAEFVL